MTQTVTFQVPTLEKYDVKLYRIPLADWANFAEIAKTTPDAANSASTVFRYGAGEQRDILDVSPRRTYDPKADWTSNSLRVRGLVKCVDSVSGEITYTPVEGVVAWNYGGQYNPSPEYVLEAIQIAASLVFQELVGSNDVPTAKVVDQLDHFITRKIFG